MADARAGLEMAKPQLRQETMHDQTYWLPQNNSIAQDPSPTAHLLPAFDEYFLGYKERNLVLDPKYDKQVVGTWKRTLKKGSVIITPSPFNSLTTAEDQALAVAADRYGAFLGLSVVLD